MFEVEITNNKGNTNQTRIQSWPPRPHEDLREVIILPRSQLVKGDNYVMFLSL